LLLARRVKLKFYEAGMDMGWSQNPTESFRIFQGRVLEEYDRIVKEHELAVVDTDRSIAEQQQRQLRAMVSAELEAGAA
jgi:dTMP kinase